MRVRVRVQVRGESGGGGGCGGGTCSSSVGSMPGGGVEVTHAIDAMEPTEPTDANEAIEPILAGHAASAGWGKPLDRGGHDARGGGARGVG